MISNTPYPTPSSSRPVWLRVGTLLDGTSTAPRRDAHVVYDIEKIRYVGDAGRTPPPDVLGPGQDRPDFEAPGATLLPGLTEAHAHLFLEGSELDADNRAAQLKRDPSELLAHADARLHRLIDLGVTAVRDAGDRNGVGLALSHRYRDPSWKRPAFAKASAGGAAGPLSLQTDSRRDITPVPYYESPGAAIHHRGRYGSFMGDPLENYPTPQACVQARVAAGADRIKLIPTGIINFQKGAVTTEPQMTTAEVAALAEAARACRRQSFAHASGDAGIDRVIDGGVDSIEHGYFIREDQLLRIRDLRTAWVPTFAPVAAQVVHADRMGWDETVRSHLRRILDGHAASLRRAHEFGVLIVAGSDAGSYGVPHGRGFLWELELMEQAGLPPIAVINAATGTGSGRLAFREEFGRIAAGCRSRLILAHHSPLETVSNLSRERIVIFDGTPRELGPQTDPAGL
ncbi:MAG TPA: amidohydrolase family protein [Opitutaceae bacterium]|nr:amidohydrolase family protein [Opitutaceae bacterium]